MPEQMRSRPNSVQTAPPEGVPSVPLASSLESVRDEFSVFPVVPGAKEPRCKWREVSASPPGWREAGTWPDGANIGIDCGKSGVVVIDEDEDGAVQRWLGSVPATYTVRTGKGHHYYFRAPDDGTRIRNGVKVAHRIDIRAAGGYVVGAGSVHESGRRYEAINPDAAVEPLPPAVLDALRAAGRVLDTAAPDADEVDDDGPGITLDLTSAPDAPAAPFELPDVIRKGERQTQLHAYAWSLVARAGGIRDAEAVVLLRDAYGRCQPTWTPQEEGYETPKELLDRVRAEHHRKNAGTRAEGGPPGSSDEVRARFPLLDLAPLVDPDRPPRRWLWEGLIPEGDQASLVAPAGEGKSLLALALSLAAVRGQSSFIGRSIHLPGRGRVLYVDMENSEDDWADRLTALGVTPAELPRLAQRFLPLSLPALPGLDTQAGGRALMAVLDTYEVGAGDLLVLDSTQRVTSGEENSNDTMRALYLHTTTALKRRGVTVLRTDNTGWNGEHERGASSKRDDVGYSILLRRDKRDRDVFTLEQTKSRGAVNGLSAKVTFRRHTVAGRLRFDTERDQFATHVEAVKDLLAVLGVDIETGVNAAWETVKQAKADADNGVGALALGEFDGITQELVRTAQRERREPVEVVP